jgi:hypothetical protein
VQNLLQQRLSAQASEELDQLNNLLSDVLLEDAPDQRMSFYQERDVKLLSGVIYRASTRDDQPCPSFKFVWRNFSPPRVKFFAWLLTKNVLQDATCEVCHQDCETADHIISGCSFTRDFWAAIGWNPDNIAPVSDLWLSQPPPRIHDDITNPMILLCRWEIWKHRNDVVFKRLPPSKERLMATCRDAMNSWACRIPRRNAPLLSRWNMIFDM